MYLGQWLIIGGTVLLIFILMRLFQHFKDEINFFATGLDNKFGLGEIWSLWKLGKEADLEEPVSLFLSVPSLNRAIATYLKSVRAEGIETKESVQNFLTKLYKFRTKINLEHQKNKGLDSTKFLDNGQRLRIIFPGKGVFKSVIVNNGYEIVITLPTQDNIHKIESEDWINKDISVYLWRKGDAHYVFDTKVTNAGIFNGQTVLYLAQTKDLVRAQKRKSVRTECNLPATMFFLKPELLDFNEIFDDSTGYRCLLEDISEDGAMVRVGGQGKVDAQIKLQFKINDSLIMMFGIVRAVEYNKTHNQSRLHFESIHVDPEMRNKILSFVYNILPEEQKDVFEALTQTGEDEKEDKEEERKLEQEAGGMENSAAENVQASGSENSSGVVSSEETSAVNEENHDAD